MKRAQIVTTIIGSGMATDAYRPEIWDAYQITSYQDVTEWDIPDGELPPPDPNIYVVEITCSDDIFAQIELDSRFLILQSEDVEEQNAI